jgi:hypothetical protein
MEDPQSQIFGEISQILEQYRKEVPGKRRAFPESVKSRVLSLQEQGLKCAEISRRSGLPYYTVIRWKIRKQSPSFEVMRVVSGDGKPRLVQSDSVTKSHRRKVNPISKSKELATVTIAMPGGVRIEGVSLKFLEALLPRFREVQ